MTFADKIFVCCLRLAFRMFFFLYLVSVTVYLEIMNILSSDTHQILTFANGKILTLKLIAETPHLPISSDKKPFIIPAPNQLI